MGKYGFRLLIINVMGEDITVGVYGKDVCVLKIIYFILD